MRIICKEKIMAKINLRKSGLPPSVFIGIITLVFFGLGGYLLITYGQGRSFLTIFAEGKSLLHQLSSGAIVGVLSAGLALMIVTRKFFTQQKHYYFRLISQWRLTYAEMIFLRSEEHTSELQSRGHLVCR